MRRYHSSVQHIPILCTIFSLSSVLWFFPLLCMYDILLASVRTTFWKKVRRIPVCCYGHACIRSSVLVLFWVNLISRPAQGGVCLAIERGNGRDRAVLVLVLLPASVQALAAVKGSTKRFPAAPSHQTRVIFIESNRRLFPLVLRATDQLLKCPLFPPVAVHTRISLTFRVNALYGASGSLAWLLLEGAWPSRACKDEEKVGCG